MDQITVEELSQRMEQGEMINLVDVREPSEHEQFNIGGILLPLGMIRNMEVDELEMLKEKELILYCRSGSRSAMACQILDSLGFTCTRNLVGGMLDWQQKCGSTG